MFYQNCSKYQYLCTVPIVKLTEYGIWISIASDGWSSWKKTWLLTKSPKTCPSSLFFLFFYFFNSEEELKVLLKLFLNSDFNILNNGLGWGSLLVNLVLLCKNPCQASLLFQNRQICHTPLHEFFFFFDLHPILQRYDWNEYTMWLLSVDRILCWQSSLILP
jgi:hypothetical protein